MRSWIRDAASLVGTGLRGLRSRLLLTVGSVLLASIAVAAAVVGPMYQSAAGASFLITRLQTAEPFTTGLALSFRPTADVPYRNAERAAVAAVPAEALPHFLAPQVSLLSDPLPVTSLPLGVQDVQPRLLAKTGACRQLKVTGRCPSEPGEMMLLEFDAEHTDTRLGDSVSLEGLSRPLTVVGTYTLMDGTTDYWFDLSRFASVLPQPETWPPRPYYPAPFVVLPRTFDQLDHGDWTVRMDRRLTVTAATTIDDLRQAVHEVARLRPVLRQSADGLLSQEIGNALKPIVAEQQSQRVTAEQTVTPAVISLILVALVLLSRLLAASMQVRQPELALAGLRGLGAGRMWVLGLLEPILMLAVAAPVGVVLGYVAARLLAASWLVEALPVTLGSSSVWFALVVLASSMAVAALVVRSAIAEPLSVQISGIRRPARPGRWLILLRFTLIAAAAVVLAGSWWSRERAKPTATDLLLPIVVAAAAGLLSTLAAAAMAGWWAKRSARRRGIAGYVASRTISRRREGTWVILPLTAALAIAVFAAGVYSAAADWRASDAVTMVGADRAFDVKLPLPQAVALTHRLDPEGQWLMAVGADADTNGAKVIVDAPRLARVAEWPSSWTPDLTPVNLSRALSPLRPSLTLAGRRVQITVDNQAAREDILLVLETVTPTGQTKSVIVGPYPPGRSSRSAALAVCEDGCDVTGLSISGTGPFAQVMKGQVTLSDVAVDGAPVPYFSRIGWREDRSEAYATHSVTKARAVGSTLTITLDSQGQPVVALLSPRDVAEVMPVVMGRTAEPRVLAADGDTLTVATSLGANARIHVVATSESTPYFGPGGMLVDYTTYTRTHRILEADTRVRILARSDTPKSVVSALAASGIKGATTLQQVRHTLDQDAYALALKLYLVVTVIVILLGLAGLGVNMAVQMPARRRDAASLRVVGVTRRSIATAVASEFTAVLGTAAIAGILAGALSQYVVVRTITLGYADTFTTPRVLPSLNIPVVMALLAVAFTIFLCLAILLGRLTIRGARAATLRETA